MDDYNGLLLIGTLLEILSETVILELSKVKTSCFQGKGIGRRDCWCVKISSQVLHTWRQMSSRVVRVSHCWGLTSRKRKDFRDVLVLWFFKSIHFDFSKNMANRFLMTNYFTFIFKFLVQLAQQQRRPWIRFVKKFICGNILIFFDWFFLYFLDFLFPLE